MHIYNYISATDFLCCVCDEPTRRVCIAEETEAEAKETEIEQEQKQNQKQKKMNN